jgi:hypothetical protein
LTLWTLWYRKTMRSRVEARVQPGGIAS